MSLCRTTDAMRIYLYRPIILILMSASLPRRAEAVYQTLTRIVNHYGPTRSVFLTLTAKKQIPPSALRKRIAKFHKLTKGIFPSIFTVMGISPFAIHVHAIAVVSQAADLGGLSQKIKRIKGSAGFSQFFSVEPINIVPAVCRYIAWNYCETAQHFALPPKRKVGRLWMYRDVPRHLLVKGSHFTRNTSAAKRYRASLTRLAELAGTEIGNWTQLERATGQRSDRIRRILFGLFQRIPSGETGLSSEQLLTAFPFLRPFRSPSQLQSSALESVCHEVEAVVS
jgi:hypothetical protein